MFSYLDTQLNRHGGPNFEQLPINRPRVPFNNNNRDGAGKSFFLGLPSGHKAVCSLVSQSLILSKGQMFIPLNKAAYYPNTLSDNYPEQANQTHGRGFFTSPRSASGTLQRAQSPTFNDVWSQPRLFWNSLTSAEQQMLVNAIRFENSKVQSPVVKHNVLIQLNRVSHDLAVRVGDALGIAAPEADERFYHDNKTRGMGTFGEPLKRLDGLKVGILAGSKKQDVESAKELKNAITKVNNGVDVTIVSPTLTNSDVGMTYSAADATTFDGVIVTEVFQELATKKTTLFPAGRPLQILLEAYDYGKSVGFFFDRDTVATKGDNHAELATALHVVKDGEGVVVRNGHNTEPEQYAKTFLDELKKFKFLDRLPVDEPEHEHGGDNATSKH